MAALNRIAFAFAPPEWGSGWELVPMIDGRSLVDLVEEATGQVYSARSARDSLPPARLLVGAEAPGVRVRILACGCGDDGCQAVGMRITLEDERVRWSEFDAELRGLVEGPIGRLGEFVFDRRQYATAIEDALSQSEQLPDRRKDPTST